jgi:hypothetical protein
MATKVDEIPPLTVDDKTLKRLDRAWRCVMEQFSSIAQERSLESGAGINLFRMLRGDVGGVGARDASHNERHGPGGTHNCQYYYVEKDTMRWSSILAAVSAASTSADTDGGGFIKTYNPETMYAVCISVPVGDVGEESIEALKLFRFDTSREVEF